MANETKRIKYTGPCKGAENRPPEVFLPGYGPILSGETFTCEKKIADNLLKQDPKVWTSDVGTGNPKIKKERDAEALKEAKKKAEAEAKKKAEAEAKPSTAPDDKKSSTPNKAGK